MTRTVLTRSILEVLNQAEISPLIGRIIGLRHQRVQLLDQLLYLGIQRVHYVEVAEQQSKSSNDGQNSPQAATKVCELADHLDTRKVRSVGLLHLHKQSVLDGPQNAHLLQKFPYVQLGQDAVCPYLELIMATSLLFILQNPEADLLPLYAHLYNKPWRDSDPMTLMMISKQRWNC